MATPQITARGSFLRIVGLGLVYLAIGIIFGELAGAADSERHRVFWRVVAWVVSANIFSGHVRYESARLRNTIPITALHAAMAAAVGALGLAAGAGIHALVTSQFRSAYLLALVLWPAITAVPAFVVALALAAVFSRFRSSCERGKAGPESSSA